MIAARQTLSGLLLPIGCGILLVAMGILMPWHKQPFAGWIVLLSAWFVLGGVFSPYPMPTMTDLTRRWGVSLGQMRESTMEALTGRRCICLS
jgi:hypothetical protein